MKSIFKLLLYILVYVLIIVVTFGTKNSELILVVLCLSLMIPILYLVNDRYKQKQKIASLNEETVKTELILLKSQINPHFFFNTLNNLYGLAVEKSDKTQEVIHKLSEMMRFTIYDGRKDSVSVKDEIKYLENFIELHLIRYKQKVDIKFTKSIENEDQRIPPLLFINLLENAFKHGLETQVDNGFIHFNLKTSKNLIEFEIENNYNKITTQKKKVGVGLENLKRRLELLFPKKHEFKTTITDNIYKSYVKIELL